VLDTGRKEILAFSNEGMFVGRLRIPGAMSMSLGEDQDLRLIRAVHGKYVLTRIDAELVLIEEWDLEDLSPSKDRIADFDINGFGQIYFINAKSDQIGKLNSDSRFIPHTYYGVRSKRISPISFADPRRIKVSTSADLDHIVVLDARHKAIKIFVEADLPLAGRLIRPEHRSRPELARTNMPRMIDYLAADSLTYIIQNGLNKKRKENRQLICKNADGQIVFGVNALTHKKKGVRSFDALALGVSRIFVLDSKAHRVHIFDRFKGYYLGSFGAKGSGRGEWRKPGGISSDGSGKIFVADTDNRRISIWNESGEYLSGIDLSKHKLKPRQIRINADGIYILANRGELMKILMNDKAPVLLPIAILKNIACFDLFDKGRIGLINHDNQQLILLDPDPSKPSLVQDMTQYRYIEAGRYFAAQAGATFPYFEDIDLIRFDPRIQTLFISDTSLISTRILKFHGSPLDK
ncbi:MAG: 6-bladed beta-propeller, partial [Candidatus Cloacimonadaceae bacterium]|nr:6-bladed beta-propeller [Candidatus Cloacimonadaceae bacterium]